MNRGSFPATSRVRRRARRRGAILGVVSLIVVSVLPAAALAAAPIHVPGPVMRTTAGVAVANRGRGTLVEAAAYAAAHPRTASTKAPKLSVKLHAKTPGQTPSRSGTFVMPGANPAALIVNAAPPNNPVRFAGLRESDDNPTAGLQLEPPDPWVAVNSSYVIQVVNNLVRVSTRTGSMVATLPEWALFSLPAGQFAADGRIVWDAAHGRWVGVLLSYNGALTDDYLNLIVSETADPRGVWDRFASSRSNLLPDYPDLASSGDRIVVTANEFTFPAGTFTDAVIVTFPWAPILAGTSLTESDTVLSGPSQPFTVRPAQVLSASNDVHLIYEALSNGDVDYCRQSGAATAPTLVNCVDLTATYGLGAFAAGAAPHNGDGTTIANAVPTDGRPTDAVWRNGRLMFVSTWFYGGGSVDVARVVQLNVTNTTGPTVANDYSHFVGGCDIWSPGIGITADGSALAVMTGSCVGTLNPFTFASRWSAADGWNTFYDIYDVSDATYGGTRWGDYVGVAADPAASDAVWASDEVASTDHAWRTTVFQFTIPALTSAPTQAIVTPSTLPTGTNTAAQTVPVRISWSASTAGDPGAHFNVDRNLDGGGFESLYVSTTATNVVLPLLVGHSYQFEVQVVNGNSEPGAWVAGPTFTPTLYQQTTNIAAAKVVYSGTWLSQSSSSFSGGSVKYASAANASATFTATGARAIGLVTDKGPTRGSFKLYVDGVLKATISTYSTATSYRQLVYQFSWSSPGTHTFKIVVVGTAGHPRVDVDAFVVLK